MNFTEVFKTVRDFPDYEISNCGRVKTKARGIRYTHAVTKEEFFRKSVERFLKVHVNGRTGYKFYQLYKNKKMYNKNIHRLVAETFLPEEPGKEYVNHKNGNKHNNVVENLEWCTNEYNHHHATVTGLKARGSAIGNSKLCEKCVRAIEHLLKEGYSHSEIARMFGVSKTTITLINTGKIWKALTAGTELEITF